MIDLVLLIARLLFVALLYLFCSPSCTGIGMVKGFRKKERGWTVSVERPPGAASHRRARPVIVGCRALTSSSAPAMSRHARFS